MGAGTGGRGDTILVAPGAMSGSSCRRVLRARRDWVRAALWRATLRRGRDCGQPFALARTRRSPYRQGAMEGHAPNPLDQSA